MFTSNGTRSGFRVARFADAKPLILKWHYTERLCAEPSHTFCWSVDGFDQAAACFAPSVNRAFGPGTVELCRLVRTDGLDVPISRLVSSSLRWLKRHTEIRFAVAYADQSVGHHGGIYQATNWSYVAMSAGQSVWSRHRVTGEKVSARALAQRYRRGTSTPDQWEPLPNHPKYLYAYPLNLKRRAMLRQMEWLEQPYPKPDRSQ